MLQRAIEKEVTEYLGREPYERRGPEVLGGYRNGYEPKAVATEGRRVEVKVPQVRNCKPFHSEVLEGLTEGTPGLKRLVLALYVRGLSTRDIEASFGRTQRVGEAFGKRVLSKSSVSEVTQTLGETFEEWRRRDLSSLRPAYLFLDGFYVRLGEGSQERTGILCAYGILETGEKVLLSVTLAEKESEECWLDCLRDLVERGLPSPLLVTADGAPGLKKAVRRVFPKAVFQRCQVHKVRNVVCKLPRQIQEVMADSWSARGRLHRVFKGAPDCATGVKWGKELIPEYRGQYPSAMQCLEKDLEECLTDLKFPSTHARRIRRTHRVRNDEPSGAHLRRRVSQHEGGTLPLQGTTGTQLGLRFPRTHRVRGHRLEEVERSADDSGDPTGVSAVQREPLRATAPAHRERTEPRGGRLKVPTLPSSSCRELMT